MHLGDVTWEGTVDCVGSAGNWGPRAPSWQGGAFQPQIIVVMPARGLRASSLSVEAPKFVCSIS